MLAQPQVEVSHHELKSFDNSAYPQMFVQQPNNLPFTGPPVQHPIQIPNFPLAPMHIPMIPTVNQMNQQPVSVNAGSSEATSPVQPTPTQFQIPGFPQMAGQMPMMFSPQMAMPQPQYIPMIQVETPQGPRLQPVFYLQNQFQQFAMPQFAQQMVAQKNEGNPVKHRRNVSKSFDGSEFSDDNKGRLALTRGLGSDVSSRDGYGSDYESGPVSRTHSRQSSCTSFSQGSFAGIFADTDQEDEGCPDMENIGSPNPFSNAFGSLNLDPNQNQAFQQQISDAVQQQKASGATPDCTACPPNFTPEDYTLNQFLQDERCPNIARYINRLEETKGQQGFHTPRPEKKRPTSKERQEALYKTELCNAWINGQKCRFGKRCIFAHGQHELRSPRLKVERNRYKPCLTKHLTSILNKITEDNYQTLTTELLCTCVEDIRYDEKDCLMLVKKVFTKACTEQNFMNLYANMWQKLLNVHPMRKVMQQQMSELCLQEYGSPKSSYFAVGCMKWISELCRRHLFGSDIVFQILDDMYNVEGRSEMNVEFWCTLIQSLRGCINTDKYFDCLATFKVKFGARIRFMIMDLEELRARHWISA